MKRKLVLAGIFALIMGASQVKAQNGIDTVDAKVEALKSELADLKKFKVTGYLQTQAVFKQTADDDKYIFRSGDPIIRRGRLKFTYSPSTLSTFVIQTDMTEKGFQLKDAYLKVTEPYLQTVTLTAGQFNRPFGNEIEYSSSMRESPERSKITTTLFPGERDLGAMLTFQAPKTSPWNFLKLDIGLFNGTGIGSGVTTDFDNKKDVIGHLNASKSFLDEKLKLTLGVSGYNGYFKNYQSTINNALGYAVYEMNGDKTYSVSSTSGDYAKRQYLGVDFQGSFDNPLGLTSIRAEYIQGKQSAAIGSGTTSPQIATTTNTYVRDFMGYYIYFTQNIGQSKHQLVVKYDFYDPNTKVKGDDIGKAVSGSTDAGKNVTTTKADLAYSTLGFGWVYRWDSNVRIMLYYDMITNEKSSNLKSATKASDYSSDIKDNQITFRIQYKF